MIDKHLKVRRIVAEYSEQTEELVAEHELARFELEKFKSHFKVKDISDTLIDCYQIVGCDIEFIGEYLEAPIEWNFQSSSYFLETHCI